VSGAHSLVHTTRILRLSEDLPVLVEMVKEGLVTVEKATVIFYRAGKGQA
jgi:PII-like signaling protein